MLSRRLCLSEKHPVPGPDITILCPGFRYTEGRASVVIANGGFLFAPLVCARSDFTACCLDTGFEIGKGVDAENSIQYTLEDRCSSATA